MRTVFDKHKLAWKHFYPEGNGKAKPGYCLHHKDETLRHENPDRYEEWRIEDLVMITSSEHGRLHHTGVVFTEEQRKRMREAQLKLSDEKSKCSKALWKNEEYRNKVCNKISEVMKGKTPWNKGRHGIYSEETIEKLRKANTGKPSPNKGRKYTEEQRKAKSECMKRWAQRRKETLIENGRTEDEVCGWQLKTTPNVRE